MRERKKYRVIQLFRVLGGMVALTVIFWVEAGIWLING